MTVLTVCDIRGVGPGTWNNWKAELLRRSAIALTATALWSTGWKRSTATPAEAEAKKRVARGAGGLGQAKDAAQRDLAPLRALLAGPADRDAHVVFADLLEGHPQRAISGMDLKPDQDRGTRRAPVSRWPIIPGIFARLAGALGAGRRERGGCAHLYLVGRVRHGGLLGAGRRWPPLRGKTACPA